MSSILEQIPSDSFFSSPEPTIVYRLGMFNETSHDLVELFENVTYPPHYHVMAQGYLHFIVGEGVISINEKESPYGPGSTFYIGREVKHGFTPKTRTLILSIQSPPVKDLNSEEDILY